MEITHDQLPEVLGTGEIAELCGVSPRTVAQWIDRGLLPGWKLPASSPSGLRHRRVARTALRVFCDQHRVPLPISIR